MNKKREIAAITLVFLVFIAGFTITYIYVNTRLTENSVRIVRAQGSVLSHEIASLPQGIRLITQEEFMEAMEEEARELTDEAFRLAIERDFNPDSTAPEFVVNDAVIHDALDEMLEFGDDDAIYEREGSSDRIYNVLFLGDDARIHQNRGRSDTIILISCNLDTRIISLTSFMRDILVPASLSGTNWNRINSMHAMGGPGRTINLLNDLFSLDIQRYAVVRFSGVFTLVDALDGLELYLTADEAAVINRIFPDFESVSAGNNLLNGRQVLAYSRMRVIDNDRARTQRQRNVLRSILTKIMDTRNLGDIFTIATFALEHVETNVPLGEIITICFEMLTSNIPVIEELRIPVDGSFNHAQYNGAYILTIDFNENTKALHEFIYDSAIGVEAPNLTLPGMDQPEI